MPEAYYRTGQAAELLGISSTDVRRLCQVGLIDAEYTGHQWRVPVAQIERLKRDGVPPIPIEGQAALAKDSRANVATSLLAPPSRRASTSAERAVISGQEVAVSENHVKRLQLKKEATELGDYFGDWERRRRAEEAEDEAAAERQRRADSEVAVRLERLNRWTDYALTKRPYDIPSEADINLEAGVDKVLARLPLSTPESTLKRLVDGTVDGALKPWTRRKETAEVIKSAGWNLPFGIREDLEVSSINRELQALRRMFHLAEEWRRVEKALPTVRMIPGENHRERVLTPEEEALYFGAATSPTMKRHADPNLLGDVARILLDCALRPEECFRLRPENITEGKLEIHFGKTDNARRRIPMTPNVQAILEMRLAKSAGGAWVFPAPTKSGHIEPSSLKKQHATAIAEATRMLRAESGDAKRIFQGFELYTLRHTCLTRWAPHMDPWTLAYLAGHRDMNITKRYVHPQQHTILDAMQKARKAKGGHSFRHTPESAAKSTPSESTVIN